MRDRAQRVPDIKAFVNVISYVKKNTTPVNEMSNCIHTSRFPQAKKRAGTSSFTRNMRPRIETSTPVRHNKDYRDPGENEQVLSDGSTIYSDESNGSGITVGAQDSPDRAPTNVSDEMGQIKIKPKIKETKTEELAKLTIAGLEYYDSLEFRNKMKGKRTRTVSSPNNIQMLGKMLKNIMLNDGGENFSYDEIDVSASLNLSDDPKFKRYHSDTSLVDYASLMNDGGVNVFIKNCEEESVIRCVEKEVLEVFDWEDFNLRELFYEASIPVCDKGDSNQEVFDGEDLNLTDLFSEDGIDYTEFHRLVEEGRKNKLYDIYGKLNEKEVENKSVTISWDKRKLSPEQEFPSKFSKMLGSNADEVVRTPAHNDQKTRARTQSTVNTPKCYPPKNPLVRVKSTGRRRSKSMGADVDWTKQKKITDMLKLKADGMKESTDLAPKKLDMEQIALDGDL